MTMSLRPVSVDSRDCSFPLCPEEAALGSERCHRHQTARASRDPADAVAARAANDAVADAIGLPREHQRTWRVSALTLDNIERLHALHRAGASINQLADAIWQRAGFKTPESCRERIRQQFKAYGLPIRSRAEAAALARQRRRAA